MNSRIRIAKKEDAISFVHIKEQLPFNFENDNNAQGGFILGTDQSTYELFIEKAFCLVAEIENKVVGFGILFNDEMVRASDIWQRRANAQWNIDIESFSNKKICYFEQLAFLPLHKRLAIQLSYNLVKWSFDHGMETLFTTTVTKPVLNLAAIPFIRIVSGIKAGNIDEVYPVVGNIKSDIYIIHSETFFSKVRSLSIYPYLKKHEIALPKLFFYSHYR